MIQARLKHISTTLAITEIANDDGIGIEKAQLLQKDAFFTHESLGSKIVRERVQLLNELGCIDEDGKRLSDNFY